MKKEYIIQDREAGNFICSVDSLEEGLKMIDKFEEDDKKEGVFEPRFYEVAEKE